MAERPERLDDAQVEHWNAANEIPENLRSAELQAALKEIKGQYPDQITSKTLSQQEYDDLSATQKVGLAQLDLKSDQNMKKKQNKRISLFIQQM